jgi:hypothetical protein
MCSAVYGDTLIVVSKYFAKYDYNIRIYSISKNKLLAEGQMPLPSNLLSVEAVHILDMKHICLLEVAKNANSRYPYTIVTKKISITNPE